MTNPYTQQIIKHLDKLLSGAFHQSQIFDDWLDIAHATLEATPRHIAAAVNGEPFEDTPEVQKTWERLRTRYTRPEDWDHFVGALAVLMQSAEDGLKSGEYQDVIGEVYEAWGFPKKRSGQFFTPWVVSNIMAKLILPDRDDIEAELHERIKAAIQKDPYAQATVLAGTMCVTAEETEDWFLKRILPAVAPVIEPITVYDPCCGSGIMLLGAASHCPRWALDYGLVQFYGQDIDNTCVKMAQVNLMLYGLNGFGLKCALELSQAELNACPEPYASAYAEAQAAHAAGDEEQVGQISDDLRAGTYQQTRLFDEVSAG